LFYSQQFRQQPYYKMRSSVECSRAHVGVVRGIQQQFLYYTVLIRIHMSKVGIVTISNRLLHIRPICWVQTNQHSMADKHSRRCLSAVMVYHQQALVVYVNKHDPTCRHVVEHCHPSSNFSTSRISAFRNKKVLIMMQHALLTCLTAVWKRCWYTILVDIIITIISLKYWVDYNNNYFWKFSFATYLKCLIWQFIWSTVVVLRIGVSAKLLSKASFAAADEIWRLISVSASSNHKHKLDCTIW